MKTELRKLHDHDKLERFINKSNQYESIATNKINGNIKEASKEFDEVFDKAHCLKYLRNNNYDERFIVDLMINYFNFKG